MDGLRVLVVDDEPPARRKIVRFLERDPAVAAVREARNGEEAIGVIERERPDLVFLDVQMPGLDGFDVLRRIPSHAVPLIVFVTAYDRFAVQAFEVEAVDYLLKPFDEARFQAALGRAKVRHARADDLASQVRSLLNRVDESTALTRILVKGPNRATLLPVQDIAWMESASNYVKLHVRDEVHLLRDTLEHLGSQLDPSIFVRVHRSHLVNLDHVKAFHAWSHGDYVIELRDGTELRMSRRYRDRLPVQFRRQL